jgi:membrane protein YdbS with pleckstrin-like domain
MTVKWRIGFEIIEWVFLLVSVIFLVTAFLQEDGNKAFSYSAVSFIVFLVVWAIQIIFDWSKR